MTGYGVVAYRGNEEIVIANGALGKGVEVYDVEMKAVTTGSPHSRNGSPTTGLGLSLEAGPSVTSVRLFRKDFLGGYRG